MPPPNGWRQADDLVDQLMLAASPPDALAELSGDYDVDGATSAALLILLRDAGLEAGITSPTGCSKAMAPRARRWCGWRRRLQPDRHGRLRSDGARSAGKWRRRGRASM
jgi:hypothetical protein